MALILRFDMRAPAIGAPTPSLYAAAIEMCAWAENRGAVLVVLSEHHGTEDNHLPAPLILASAIAARTERIAILLAAVVLPFCDPVRLAEEMSVLDIISRGRATYVFGIGHRVEEYEHFGIDVRRRGKLADEKLALLLELLAARPVDHEGRHIRVTPPPISDGGPRVMIAGGSVAAAKRAGRFGLGLIAQADAPGMREAYEAECRAHGHEPGVAQFPDPRAPTAVFVADDVERAWHEIGPYLLHDAVTAASYRQGGDGVASITRAESVEQLRAMGSPYRIFTSDEATAHVRTAGSLRLLPLCAGLPPQLAWPYLKRAADAVAAARQQP